jgi:hypothetical protein
LDEYILFSKNEEGTFEVKIPFSSDSLSQVSDLLTKEGVLVKKGEIERLQSELTELKSMVAEMKKDSKDFSVLMRDILKGFKQSEEKSSPPQPSQTPSQASSPEGAAVPESKISMLPSAKTKAFKLIGRLAKEHMDREFTTSSLSLYDKRVFSLLVKRYEFVTRVRKEGRSIVYKFTDRALESICAELGGTTSASVRSRMRSKNLEDFLQRVKDKYPHFAYYSKPGRSAYKQYKLLFSDSSVKKSVEGDLTRMFGPSTVKLS